MTEYTINLIVGFICFFAGAMITYKWLDNRDKEHQRLGRDQIQLAFDKGKANGYEEAMKAKEKDALSKDEKDMIRQVLSVLSYGGQNDNQEDGK